MTRPVADCLDSCPPHCSTVKVSILSLGSKMIDSDYGISLTISPEVDSITEELDYVLLNLVAELSASISFLFGLSAIAIYDWLVAFCVWSAIKLGLFRDAAGEDDEPGAYDAEGAPTLSPVPRLQVQSEDEDTSPSPAPPGNDTNASLIWYVEPSARKGGNQVAPLEPAGEQRQSPNSLDLPKDPSPLATFSPSTDGALENTTPINASPQPDPMA
ncbi:uncharacterized protein LOC119097655 [Pollicipes pollicipes]|nr:uncharacterized protein LOC119097655 [Pollicipes pollicipes]